MGVEFKDVPETAAANEPIIINLIGKEYTFKEPPRKLASAMIGNGLDIMVTHGLMLDEETNEAMQGIGLFKAMPELIDWVADCLLLNKTDCKKLDNEFDMQELGIAFGLIIGHLQRPFVGGLSNTEEAPTPTKKTL